VSQASLKQRRSSSHQEFTI